MILLTYAVARFIDLPVSALAEQLPGFFVSFEINVQIYLAILASGLTAAGADWLIRDHPALGRHQAVEHWLLPALTALVIGIPLFQLPLGALWWSGFILGGAILILVLIAEYIVIDEDDLRQPMAAVGLTIVSFALYLILAISLRYSDLRLYLILPALTITAGLIVLRTLHLRLGGTWAWLPAALSALIVGQFTAALHYWPLAPVSFGLMLVGLAYCLASFFGALLEGNQMRKIWIEPALILLIFWGAALWIG